MTDLQAAIDTGRLAAVPEGVTQITSSVRLRSGAALRGAGRGLSVVEVLTPGIDAIIIESDAETRTSCDVGGFTVRTLQTGVTGLRSTRSSANLFDDLTFQGCTQSLNIDQGLNNVVGTVWSETWGSRPAGQLRIWSSDPTVYVQYIDIQSYHAFGGCAGPAVVFCRATNVDARLMIHEPGQDGVLITDDCQGIMLSGYIVKPNNGVILSAFDQSRPTERRPSFIDTRRLNVDQATGIGVLVFAGTDLDIGGQITNGDQGIVFAGYPAVERLKIDSRLAEHHNNAIVAESGARFFSVVGASACGSGGAALVVSPGPSRDFTVADNDFSQGNRGGGFIDLSGASAQANRATVVAGNR